MLIHITGSAANANESVLREGSEYVVPADVYFKGQSNIIRIPAGWAGFFELNTLTLMHSTGGLISIETGSYTRQASIQILSQPADLGDGLVYRPEGDVQSNLGIITSLGDIEMDGISYPAGLTIRAALGGAGLVFLYFDQYRNVHSLPTLAAVVNHMASGSALGISANAVTTETASDSVAENQSVASPAQSVNSAASHQFAYPEDANISSLRQESKGVYHLGNLRMYAPAIGASFSFPREMRDSVLKELNPSLSNWQMKAHSDVSVFHELEGMAILFTITGGIASQREVIDELPKALIRMPFLEGVGLDFTLEVQDFQSTATQTIVDFKRTRNYDGIVIYFRDHMVPSDNGQIVHIRVSFDPHEQETALYLAKAIADSVHFHSASTPPLMIGPTGGYTGASSKSLLGDGDGQVSGSSSSSLSLCANGTYSFKSSSVTNVNVGEISLRSKDSEKHQGHWFSFVSLNGDTNIPLIDSDGIYRKIFPTGTPDDINLDGDAFHVPGDC